MNAVGLIPARYRASRFPGKPLVPIAGKPMIQHVYEGARQAKRLREVVVATDDERIAAACSAFGAPVVLTSPDHPTGTDRLAEAVADLAGDLIVNVQGDEPLIEGFVIDAAVDALASDPDAVMSTLVHEAEPSALADPNRVKVVLDHRGRALWFSRACIPLLRETDDPADMPTWWQHVGLYVYRREFLMSFVRLPQTPCERAEGLEQLRALEHGHAIRAAVIEGWRSRSVDVPDDVHAVARALRERGR